MKNIVELKKESFEKVGLPITPATIKGWWNKGQHLDLRIKIGGRVFLNLSKFYKKFGLDEEMEG